MGTGNLTGDQRLFIPLCVVFSDYTKKLHTFDINSRQHVSFTINQSVNQTEGGNNEESDHQYHWHNLDAINVCLMIQQIANNANYRKLLRDQAKRCHVHTLYLQMVPPEREIIDYKWNHLISRTVWERVEVENLMSWLSTLGGGFSALGEQFTKFAETAGKISLKQLDVGLRLGDPFLQARCKLYYSISLIQTGRLRAAKYIVREQYEFARHHKETDKRLVNMCKGIWLRLQYEYSLRDMLSSSHSRSYRKETKYCHRRLKCTE